MNNFYSIFKCGLIAAAIAGSSVASPSFAADPSPVPCEQGITINAISCATAAGNLNNNSPADNLARAALWTSIGGAAIGQSLWTEKLEFKDDEVGVGDTFSFVTPLSGISFLAIHWGGGSSKDGGPGNATVFYKLDAGSGLSSITANFRGISNAALYSTGVPAVPEPATWMFMLLGMAGVGFSMRRKDKQILRVRYT